MQVMGQLPGFNRSMKCLVSAVSLTICSLVVHMIKLLGFTGFGMFQRLEELRRVARDRSDFRGIEQRILREATLKYLWQFQKDAQSCSGAAVTFLQEESRMKASVLRLLLTGGIFTQDVVTRHKQSCNTLCDCALGGVANIRHVSWECSHYSAYRRPPLFLSQRLQQACHCLLYAAILTESVRDLIPHVVLIQSVLVDIWRAHIKKYLYNELGPDPPQPSPATSSSVPAVASAGVVSDEGASSSGPSGISENGHFISGAVGGGFPSKVWQVCARACA